MKSLLKKSNGANFLKADLHLHTPFDRQFSCNGIAVSSDDQKRDFTRKYLEKAKSQSLNIIAITEHNDTSWIPVFQEINKEDSFNDLVIFPGLEIGSKEGIHLLILFNPHSDKSILENFLIKIGLEKNRVHDNTMVFSTKTFDEILDLVEKEYTENQGGIKKHSALVIPAHFDCDNGLYKQENAQSFYKHASVIAVQINKKYEELKDGVKNILSGRDPNYNSKPVAVIESSDARKICDIGKNASYLKLSSPTVEGLRQAFLDPEARIRHQSNHAVQSFSRLLAAKFEGGFLNGLEIRFNDNLNCLVGGKGTGKSTIIEVLKYALSHENKKMDDLNKQSRKILDSVFKAGSKATLLIENVNHSTQYIIEANYPNAPIVKEFQSGKISDLPASKVLPNIDVYRQKEIYELSNQQEAQLEIIKRFYSEDIHDTEIKKEEIISQLYLNKTDIEKSEKQLEQASNDVSDLAVLKANLERYKKLKIEEDFKRKNIYEKEKQALETIKEELGQNISFFTDLSEREYFQSLDRISKEFINRETFDTIKNNFLETEKQIKSKLNEAKSLLEKADIKEIENGWKLKYNEAEEKYFAKLREIKRDKSGFNPEEYIRIEKDIAIKEQFKEIAEKHKEALKNLYNKRTELLSNLHGYRAEIFRKQKSVCVEKINKKLEGILNVDLTFEGMKEQAVEFISDFKSGIQNPQIEKIVKNPVFTFIAFAEMIRKGEQALIDAYGITDAAANKLYKGFSSSQIFESETFEIQPAIKISLNTSSKEHPDYRDTSRLSVGQRCTALLTLLLLENKDPILIDQPEDDLDKSFIFEDVVNKLRKEKERRQFIIATHDANIAVLGDAEQMIVLNSTNENVIPDKCIMNNIDDDKIKLAAERLLEGGKEAFNKRRQKYGF